MDGPVWAEVIRDCATPEVEGESTGAEAGTATSRCDSRVEHRGRGGGLADIVTLSVCLPACQACWAGMLRLKVGAGMQGYYEDLSLTTLSYALPACLNYRCLSVRLFIRHWERGTDSSRKPEYIYIRSGRRT